jgi:hypothetical protein
MKNSTTPEWQAHCDRVRAEWKAKQERMTVLSRQIIEHFKEESADDPAPTKPLTFDI